MAIAAIVAYSSPSRLRSLQEALRAVAGRVDCQLVAPDRIAASVEAPSDILPRLLQQIQDLPDLLNLELVYVNYEEDLDDNGNMPCPPISEFMKRDQ